MVAGKMNGSVIRLTGKVAAPDGDCAPRREIGISNRQGASSLRWSAFPNSRGRGATPVTLHRRDDTYQTGLRRYERGAYIKNNFRGEGYHLREFLGRYGLDRRGTLLELEVRGYDIFIVGWTFCGATQPGP